MRGRSSVDLVAIRQFRLLSDTSDQHSSFLWFRPPWCESRIDRLCLQCRVHRRGDETLGLFRRHCRAAKAIHRLVGKASAWSGERGQPLFAEAGAKMLEAVARRGRSCRHAFVNVVAQSPPVSARGFI